MAIPEEADSSLEEETPTAVVNDIGESSPVTPGIADYSFDPTPKEKKKSFKKNRGGDSKNS